VIVRNLPHGYCEGIAWGMITYAIPLERYPDTYNGQPLCYAALAAQTQYCSLYLMGAYADPRQAAALRAAFARAKKPLDMGKSCLRFRSAIDLPLEDVARLIAAVSPEAFIAQHEAARAGTGRARRRASRRATATRAK
jgi:hypothetical protein